MLNDASPFPDFAYDTAQDGAGLPARVAIFGEDEGLRRQIGADLGGAGFRSIDGGGLRALLEGPIALLGDVVVVDCAVTGSRGIDGMMLAGLARLDMRVSRSGAKLIVATNLAGLDDVFAVLDQSNPQILVSPSRAERVIAVGRVMGEAGAARLREMGEEDRVALLRLSQQVEAIAHSLDRLSKPEAGRGTVLGEFKRDFRSYRPDTSGPELPEFGGGAAAKQSDCRAALPDPQMVRQIIANRQARARFFDPALFGDPAWDMLLDLTAAHGEGAQVSVTSLCIAAGVPATTALRWLTQMVETGIFIRVPDPADRRRAFIALSEKAIAAMSGYFASLRTPVLQAA
ncbi:MarR family transcriptional regulator [Porphyrobacter sp. ULC335]|uniref:MarR family transcriptional regulator n=1 Tax=Porphyrobacter sp. ULC335 TaxID=2854260 RepID=UPI002220A79F|nr:MarR family transcriptional regulator [Porphyrobacter sp. ULC335]UYV17279.1 MarR family transcriptional regulator [Porphyrobacter sp. ULC335]